MEIRRVNPLFKFMDETGQTMCGAPASWDSICTEPEHFTGFMHPIDGLNFFAGS